jgi:mRNA interferase RelE/StbE
LTWRIEFAAAAARDLARWDRQVARRILTFLEHRVAASEEPRQVGAALRGGHLGGLWKYRIGDYRVIASLDDGVMLILVVSIGHRREVYR